VGAALGASHALVHTRMDAGGGFVRGGFVSALQSPLGGCECDTTVGAVWNESGKSL